MNKILIIDPGKGWGHFVSKMYCYQKLAECLGSKIIFLTKKSTQAEHYLNEVNFCDKVIYLDEPKKGIENLIFNFKSFINNINKINKLEIEDCFVFHPSLRYLMIAKFSKISNIWSLGKKFQNFFIDSNRKLYSNFFSKTIANDNEALEFVKKITNSQNINFKPLLSNKNNYPNTIGIIIAASGIEKRWSIENYFKVINFLIEKKFKKFLIISGVDQYEDEQKIKNKYQNKIEIICTSKKKINEIIPYLKQCNFCIGNDTGFSHLSVNFDIPTFVIYGDCAPQSYSKLIKHIDIDKTIVRSSSSINTIKFEKVLNKLSEYLLGRGGREV